MLSKVYWCVDRCSLHNSVWVIYYIWLFYRYYMQIISRSVLLVCLVVLSMRLSVFVYAQYAHDTALSFIEEEINAAKEEEINIVKEEKELVPLDFTLWKIPATVADTQDIQEPTAEKFVRPKIIPPTLTLSINPQGLLISNSVRSFGLDVAISQRCSLITKNNLSHLTWLPSSRSSDYITTIPQWHATDLINEWVSEWWLVESWEGMKKQEVLDRFKDITTRNDTYSVYDIYMLRSSEQDYYLQSHRALLFRASDGVLYVLDPIRGKKTYASQVFSEYIDYYDLEDIQWYSSIWYPLDTSISIDESLDLKILPSNDNEIVIDSSDILLFDELIIQQKIDIFYDTIEDSLAWRVLFHIFLAHL